MKQIVITGASGYIGRYLMAAARARGWRAFAATRRCPANGVGDWIPYVLEDEVLASRFPAAAVLVHLAANTSVASDADEQRVIAARRLLWISRERGSRFIFVSSQTARPGAPTAYGRAKWRIEQDVRAAGGSIVRPGLVYGGAPGGVFGQLCRLVQHSIFLPALIPSPRVQPIHVMDLAEGILRIVERDDLPPGEYNLADPEADSVHLRLARHCVHATATSTCIRADARRRHQVRVAQRQSVVWLRGRRGPLSVADGFAADLYGG
jgi:NADH dehydrogenase